MNWKSIATLSVSVKLRNDLADYDYLDKLNKKELNWLKGFHREWVNADFKHKYKKHHTSAKAKRIIYNLNNHRNMDLYGRKKWDSSLWIAETVQEKRKKFNPIWYKFI